VAVANRAEQALSAARSLNISLLTPIEPGRRNRRTIDGVLLAVGALLIGLAGELAASAPAIDRDIADALTTIFGWANAVWRTVFLGLLVLAVLILVEIVRQRRWGLARDLFVALVAVYGLGILLGGLVKSDWFPIEGHVWSNWGFPELRLASATAVISVAAPELVRPVRVIATWLVGLGGLGVIAFEAALPSGALGGLSLGLGAAALVRLAFGSAAAVPSIEQVRDELAALGVDVSSLTPSPRQQIGSAEYLARDTQGRPLRVRVLGRDAQDTQRLARQWRLLAYKDPPRSAPVGRLEQVEHEALATTMAAQAGVRVPAVVLAALGTDDDALLVTCQPDIEPLETLSPDEVSDETLDELCKQVDRLHAAGISHGRLNLSNVRLTDDGPMLVDLSAATLGAPQSAVDIDVAELLVACTVLVGPKRALGQAVEAGWTDSIARILPYLQRAALTPHLRDLARTQEVGLKELRAKAAAATGQEEPKLVPMRRVRPRDVVSMVLVGFAAYLLITQLAEIGFGTIAHSLREASVPWVLTAVLLASATFIPSAISLRGAVLTPLPLLPCIGLASAVKFVNLTVPSAAGRIAFTIRFLQRMGAPTGEAVAAGAVDRLSETLVELVLVVCLLPFVDLHIDTGGLGSGVPSTTLIVVVFGLLVGIVVLFLAVPALRTKVVPPLREGLSSLWAVAKDRQKRMELFGGNLGTEVFFALTLGAACHAYGVHLLLIQLLVINMTASALSGLIPVPGGVGAAEAGLTAGLVAMGVDESTAFAIALTHRLCTNYLPPIWGYFALQWLQRKDYV
jgi:glycosyltransferase 2 family protein